MFSTAESLVRRGALDIEQIRWMDLQQGTYGLDGLLYSRKGIGLPIALLPLTWLGLVVPWWGTVSVSLLFNALITALTAVLLLAYVHLLGFSQRTSLIVALTFGLTTLAWSYAKSLFSDPFSGLLLLAAAYMLLKFKHRPSGRQQGADDEIDGHPLFLLRRYPIRFRWYVADYLQYPFLAGLLLGWNVATRYAELLFVPVFGLLLLYYLGFGQTRPLLSGRRYPAPSPWPPLFAFVSPIVLIGLGLITFNLSRYGDPFNTGYLPEETFSAVLWQGLLGQLASPARGLLLFCPIFILSFFGLLPSLRRFRAEALLALSVILIHLFLYGKWFMWHGGFAWGPRFMIPTLPFWAIFLAPIAARAFPGKSLVVGASAPEKDAKVLTANISPSHKDLPGSILRLVYLTLAILGLIPQLLMVSLDFTPFQVLLLDTGLPLFDPQTFFNPQYSPLLSAWQLLATEPLDLAWASEFQINWWLLATLVSNVIITGFCLIQTASQPGNDPAKQQSSQAKNHNLVPLRPGSGQAPRLGSGQALILHWLPLLSTLIALLALLFYTHTLPPASLRQSVAALNANIRPADAVISNNPEAAILFAELYKGRGPVLGLNQGGFPLPREVSRRLVEVTRQHEQVWWLPNWLPPAESAIEQTLLVTGFRAREDNFFGQRLVLFAFPASLADQIIPINLTFGQIITLNQAAYPPVVSPGTALPVQLQWQAVGQPTENYHVFIHLATPDGQIVAQSDGQPVYWTRPTATWQTGEIITDRHGLWLPPDTPSGNYQLRLGLYRPADGQRLHLSDGQDSVQLEIMAHR